MDDYGDDCDETQDLSHESVRQDEHVHKSALCVHAQVMCMSRVLLFHLLFMLQLISRLVSLLMLLSLFS